MSPFTTFLKSKVARRISFLFVLCALLPITALAVISFIHVTGQLYEQSQKRLRQVSKATGMAIYERLTVLESETKMIAAQLATGSEATPTQSLKQFDRDFSKRFNGVVLKLGEKLEPLYGSALIAADTDPIQQRHLASGKTLLDIRSGEGRPVIIVLSRWVKTDDPGKGLLLAEVNAAYLWLGGEGVSLPAMTEMCIFKQPATAVFCTLDDPEPLAQRMSSLVGQSEASYLEWENDSETYLASYWTIPLQFQFSLSPLTVVMSESKRGALAPLDSFKYTFVIVVVLALCIVTLLSHRWVHSSLGPLEQLQGGTRRIADRDFTARVAIASEDEFGDLAQSFNTMAERLGKQFQMLETMSAISRAILSSYESRGIVEVLQSRISDALACDAVSVAILDGADATSGTMSTRLFAGSERHMEYSFTLAEPDLTVLPAHSDHYEVGEGSVPHYLSRIAEKGVTRFLIFPIMIQRTCSGLLALGYRGSVCSDQADLTHARQLADQVSVALSNLREITRRIQADAQAHFLEHYDQLTKLANRKLFHQAIDEALCSSAAHRRNGALLLINLDRFQRVNDTFGPRAGDRLLQDVAGRIERYMKKDHVLPEPATVGRLGADQFGVLMPHLASESETVRIGQSLLGVISQPYEVGGNQIFLTASAGIALLHQDGEDPDLLVRNADTAMRAAKEKGRNLCQFYSESMNQRLAARMTLEGQIRAALEREEFRLYYQPQVDVRSGAVVGVEALIRWQHPERGFISPAEFVPVAEEEEHLIVSMGEWVIRTACEQQRAWHKVGLPSFDIAINVSALHFRRADFVERFDTIVRETGADVRYLELELTETVLMNDSQNAIAILKRLRAMGVRLAMDDFGTGYSSLAYLRQFPIDKLKIDRAFVNGIAIGSDGAAITSAIVAMGHALNLHVLAEGVETQEQLAFLRDRGCHTFQGYLFSQPLSVIDATNLFRQHLRQRLAQSA